MTIQEYADLLQYLKVANKATIVPMYKKLILDIQLYNNTLSVLYFSFHIIFMVCRLRLFYYVCSLSFFLQGRQTNCLKSTYKEVYFKAASTQNFDSFGFGLKKHNP